MKRTGYHVYAFGQRWWTRTIEGAWRRYRAEKWAADHRQIIECATGARLDGMAQDEQVGYGGCRVGTCPSCDEEAALANAWREKAQ